MWDIDSGKCMQTCRGHESRVLKVSVLNRMAGGVCSDIGSDSISAFPMIVSCGIDQTVRFWDVNGPKLVT